MDRNSRIIIAILFIQVACICLILMLICVPNSEAGTEIDASLSSTMGKVDAQSGNVIVFYEKGNFSSESIYSYAKTDNIKSEDLLSNSATYIRPMKGNWDLWMYEKIATNNLRDIKFESFTGTGFQCGLKKTDTLDIRLTIGAIEHYLKYDDNEEYINRLTGMPQLKYLTGDFEINAFCDYQPNIDDNNDYIIISGFSIRLGITEKMGVKYRVTSDYRAALIDEKHELTHFLGISTRF